MAQPDVVAVINTSEDTTDLLRVALEHAGFVVVTVFSKILRDGKLDFEGFIRQHQPRVIIWDIAIPYEANWRLFEHYRDTVAAKGTKFVLTTTNVTQLRKVAGAVGPIHEIVGKPYDLNILIQAVRQAAAP